MAELTVNGQDKTILFHTAYGNHGMSFWDYSGPGTMLWDWDHSGDSGKLTVTLPPAMRATKATPVDLRGAKSGPPIEIMNGHLTFDLGPFAPASWIVN